MDNERFDKLARVLANGSDRRGFLKRVAGVVAGAAVVSGPGRVLAQDAVETTPLGYGEKCYVNGEDPCNGDKHLFCSIPEKYDPKYGYDTYDPKYGYYDYGTSTYYPYGTCDCIDTYEYSDGYCLYTGEEGHCTGDDASTCYDFHYGYGNYYYNYADGKYYADKEYKTPIDTYECVYDYCVLVEEPEKPEKPDDNGNGHTPPPTNGHPPKKDKKAALRRRRLARLRRQRRQRRNRRANKNR
jgi:hypothetical protein